jgi:hypothetical protein
VLRTIATLTMAQRSKVVLVDDASAVNVWWIVGTTATPGTLVSGNPDTTRWANCLVAGSAVLRGLVLSGRVASFSGAIALNGRVVPTK